MATKKYRKGFKPTFNAEDIVFNTEKDFAESGIEFDGDYQTSGSKTYVKAIELPGGKWIGRHALKTVLREGSINTLLASRFYPTEDKESECWVTNLQGSCMHTLLACALMDGETEEEAIKHVANVVVDLNIGFSAEDVSKWLNEKLFTI